MNAGVAGILAVGIAYLVGSLPFGYLSGRLVAGIDIRTAGSRNVGATNVGRVLGAKWGALVLLLDGLKGLLPVLLLPRFMLAPDETIFAHVAVASGAAAILGHMYPPWLGFRGGKGVATAAGVVLVLGPWSTAAAAGVFAISFLIVRIVSLGSILAAITFAACQMWLLGPNPFSDQYWSLAAFSLLVPLWIIVRHRSNLVRLLRGDEPRFQPRSGGQVDRRSEDQTLDDPKT